MKVTLRAVTLAALGLLLSPEPSLAQLAFFDATGDDALYRQNPGRYDRSAFSGAEPVNENETARV